MSETSQYFIARRFAIAAEIPPVRGRSIVIVHDPTGDCPMLVVSKTIFSTSLLYGHWPDGMLIHWQGRAYYVSNIAGSGYLIGADDVYRSRRNGGVAYLTSIRHCGKQLVATETKYELEQQKKGYEFGLIEIARGDKPQQRKNRHQQLLMAS